MVRRSKTLYCIAAVAALAGLATGCDPNVDAQTPAAGQTVVINEGTMTFQDTNGAGFGPVSDSIDVSGYQDIRVAASAYRNGTPQSSFCDPMVVVQAPQPGGGAIGQVIGYVHYHGPGTTTCFGNTLTGTAPLLLNVNFENNAPAGAYPISYGDGRDVRFGPLVFEQPLKTIKLWGMGMETGYTVGWQVLGRKAPA